MSRAQSEIQEAEHFDHVIINDDLERAYGELKAILQKALET
jgi:guanylate kinase